MKWDSIAAFAVSIGTFWAAAKVWIAKVKPIIEPMILEAENDAKDGVIDLADRKHILMVGVDAAGRAGLLTVNIITRFLISKLVNYMAEKLPDFKIKVNDQPPDDYNKPTMQ